MIRPMFCIKDVKTTFWKPFVSVNEQDALREFRNMINSGHEFATMNYPDLELWKLGIFDDITGDISPALEYIACGKDFFIEQKVVNNGE